ncbi:MAG: Ribonuclease HI [candidate division TM6 bacterium GW2011_GWF2_32_72]|nr:MAG: Ribonuclease HI [candidate division TM6 bacterium GW2011_GWF2_32_72]
MAQLNLFSGLPDPKPQIHKSVWKLYIDGAARNNPGPAGAGVYLLKGEEPAFKRGFYLGVKTNNQAEYMALLIGAFIAKKEMQPGDALLIISDSLLLVKQMKGEYKVSNQDLQKLHKCARELLHDIKHDFTHVLRENNTVADKLANAGIDKKVTLPTTFVEFFSKYE